MKKKIIIFFVVAIFILLPMAFLIRVGVIEYRISDDYTNVLNSEKYGEEQELVVTVNTFENNSNYRIIESLSVFYGGGIIKEADIAEKYGEISVSDVLRNFNVAKECLKDKTFELKKNCSNSEVLIDIYKSLESGNPVSMLMMLDDRKGNFDLSYALVTGCNYKEKAITIATAYGDTRIISVEEFLKATKFENVTLPMRYNFDYIFTFLSKNTMFIIR